MSIKKTRIWKFFSSIKLAIWLLAMIAALSLLGTLIPQNQEAGFYIDRFGHWGYRALEKTALIDVYASPPFIFLIILFAVNLTVCLLNRLSLKMRMLGSVLSHVSILIILIGALVGMFFGQKGLIKIGEGEEVCCFSSKGKHKIDLGFSIRLDKFIYSEHIDPKEKLLVSSAQDSAIIAKIPTEIGVESNIADTGYKIKILRYLPDFVMDTSTKATATRSAVPNNPAIEAQLRDKAGRASTFWVFARFPDMHQKTDPNFKFTYRWVGRRPKDFISKVTVLKGGKEMVSADIRVNEPLHFDGYTFFQSTYDTEALSWSGLQVVKDPGVPIVYAGFILLMLGLVTIFYVNPLIQRPRSETAALSDNAAELTRR